MVHPRLSKDLVPLLTANGGYQAEYRHNSERRTRCSNTDSDSQSVEKIPMDFLYDDGCEVHRRLHEHSVLRPLGEQPPEWGGSPRRYPRAASLRFFVFSACAAVLLLMMYVPAYKQASSRPDVRRMATSVGKSLDTAHVFRKLLKMQGSVAGWSYNTSRDTRTYVLPDNVTLLNQPKHVCRQKPPAQSPGAGGPVSHQMHSTPGPPNASEPEIFLLVIICSSMSHFERRAAIRETWGNQSSYEFLARHFENITKRFAGVNMTEALFNEMGYALDNISSIEKRIKRDATNYEEFADGDDEFDEVSSVPTGALLDAGKADFYGRDVNGSDVVREDEGAVISNGNDRDRNPGAFNEILSNDVISYDFVSDSPVSSSISSIKETEVDRIYSNNGVATQQKVDRKELRIIESPYKTEFVYDRRKRESLDEALKENKYIKKKFDNEVNNADDPRFDNGEKKPTYDEVNDNQDEQRDDNILGNFEGNEVEEQQNFEEYDYQTEESNIMRIPPRGFELPVDGDDAKALQEAKNLMKLSLKGDKLSLAYGEPRTADEALNKNIVNVHDSSTRELLNDKYVHGYSARESLDDSAPKLDEVASKRGSEGFARTKYLFLLGQSANDNETELQARIDDEAAMHGDIIQEGFVDSYNNLTLKSVMLLKWVVSNCGDNVHYIMKTDDDMFVNIPRLIEALQNKSREFARSQKTRTDVAKAASEKLLMGDLICDARPISDMRSKWYSPKYMYSGKVYPRYLSGSGYVMSLGAAQQLYRSALNTPLFHLEDVFITGMCSHKAGIKPTDHPGFSYAMRKFNTCVYAYLITAHQVTVSQMRHMFTELASPAFTHHLEACEARRLLSLSAKATSFLASAKSSLFSRGIGLLGSPRSIITGLAGFGYADARKKKLKRSNNGCS